MMSTSEPDERERLVQYHRLRAEIAENKAAVCDPAGAIHAKYLADAELHHGWATLVEESVRVSEEDVAALDYFFENVYDENGVKAAPVSQMFSFVQRAREALAARARPTEAKESDHE